MARTPLSAEDLERGRRLVEALKARRETAGMTAAGVSAAAAVPIDTVRAIEAARVLTPSFLIVAALGKALGVSLDELAAMAWEDT